MPDQQTLAAESESPVSAGAEVDAATVRFPPPVELFRSDHLRVFARTPFGSDTVAVTFSSYHELPTLDRPGFGELFLLHSAQDAVHVVCRDNRWFQHDEMPAALEAVRRATANHAAVVTYGLSMGGYAAINFSEALGACRVVAISPQFSVDPRRVPWERRWRADAQRIRFVCDGIARLRGTAPVFAVYDDQHRLDRRHVALIRRTMPVVDVPVPFARHPVTSFLVEAGLLSHMALDLIRGNFDAAAFHARVAAAQRCSATWLLGVHRALPPHRVQLRRRLLRQAEATICLHVGRGGNQAVLLSLSRALRRTGRRQEATAVLRGLVRSSAYMPPRIELAELLLRCGGAGDAAEAEALLREPAALPPATWTVMARALRVAALARLGRHAEAAAAIRALKQDGDAPRRLLWRLGLVTRVRHLPLRPAWKPWWEAGWGLALDALGRHRHALRLARDATRPEGGV